MVNLVAADVGKLRIEATFPHQARFIEDLRIPLADGTVLTACLWLPEDAQTNPVPAVIEYVPFRQRDFTAPRDAVIHPWFAGQGYAAIRLDTRGSQNSTGAPLDEYVLQEQLDGVEALAWIADQPWCSGQTGLFGMSWGAFSALQIAALRPPSLKAIIPVHGTDERFGDDIHFKGGCLLSANLSWGWTYTNYMMRPPDPLLDPDTWRETWRERIETAPCVVEAWVANQSRNAYWRHASVSDDPSAIEAATYIFCGWADGYTNAALRMTETLTCPVKTVIGPWAHTYPHIAMPAPQIGFLQEATRWWDRWLKGIENGIDQEPKLTYWQQEAAPPQSSYTERGGHWVATDRWPIDATEYQRLHLNAEGLKPEAGERSERSICTPLSAGMTGGEWLPHGVGPEMPLDQRTEDAGALTFDTADLPEDLFLCGRPRLSLKLKVDQPKALLHGRLIDVAPGGSSRLICYGLLNLTGRNGFEDPTPVPVNEWLDVTLDLDAIAQRVPAGHRLRLSIGTNSFPLVWPMPQKATVTLALGSSWIDLPLHKGRPVPSPFEGPALPKSEPMTWLRPVNRERVITKDVVTGVTERRYFKDDGAYVVPGHGMGVDVTATMRYTCRDDDPLSATAHLTNTMTLWRGDWRASLDSEMTMRSDEDRFEVEGCIHAEDEEGAFADRDIAFSVPRQFI